ncbi:MAG: DNA polymerase III subunit delta [Dehalococcoidia bacterium]
MLHVFIGEDDFSIREALEEIKTAIGDAAALLTNTTMLDGAQVSIEQLKNACETVPFLADKRLVIVEGLLRRFEPAGKSNRKKSKKNENGPEYRAFSELAGQLPEFTELVIVDGRVNSRNPLLAELTRIARVRSFPVLKEPQLKQWITRRMNQSGSDISPAAVNALVRFVGNDLWLMSNEIAKLFSYAGGRRIEEEDIKAVVSNAQDASVFALVDAIVESRTRTAQVLLQNLLRQGAAPAQILTMIARQVRIIFQIREMRSLKKTRAEIQSKLGLTHDFVLRKAWEQADKYTPSRLKEVYHRLLDTDIAIKTGKYEGDLALDILIAELGQRQPARS